MADLPQEYPSGPFINRKRVLDYAFHDIHYELKQFLDINFTQKGSTPLERKLQSKYNEELQHIYKLVEFRLVSLRNEIGKFEIESFETWQAHKDWRKRMEMMVKEDELMTRRK